MESWQKMTGNQQKHLPYDNVAKLRLVLLHMRQKNPLGPYTTACNLNRVDKEIISIVGFNVGKISTCDSEIMPLSASLKNDTCRAIIWSRNCSDEEKKGEPTISIRNPKYCRLQSRLKHAFHLISSPYKLTQQHMRYWRCQISVAELIMFLTLRLIHYWQYWRLW